jgi:hypothetical protein
MVIAAAASRIGGLEGEKIFATSTLTGAAPPVWTGPSFEIEVARIGDRARWLGWPAVTHRKALVRLARERP